MNMMNQEEIIQMIAVTLLRAKQISQANDRAMMLNRLNQIATLIFHLYYNNLKEVELKQLPKLEMNEGIEEIIQEELQDLNNMPKKKMLATLILKCQALTMNQRWDSPDLALDLEMMEIMELKRQGRSDEEIEEMGRTPLLEDMASIFQNPRNYVKA